MFYSLHVQPSKVKSGLTREDPSFVEDSWPVGMDKKEAQDISGWRRYTSISTISDIGDGGSEISMATWKKCNTIIKPYEPYT